MSKSNYLEQLAIEWLGNIGTPTRPTAFYVALFTDSVTEAELEAGIFTNEVSALDDANYTARIAMTGSPPWQHNGDNSAIENINAVAFNGSAATSTYTVTHFAITNNATLATGDILWWGRLAVPKTIDTLGQVVTFQAGDIVITED